VRTLTEHPHLGRHLRKLHWTVVDLSHLDEDFWEDPDMESGFDERRNALDATCLTIDGRAHSEYARQSVPNTHIRTTKRFDDARMVDRILSCSSKHIQKLEPENLLQWSGKEPPLPNFITAEDLAQYWKDHKSQHTVIPESRHMAGALDLYVGNCATLTALCISTAGNGHYWHRKTCSTEKR